PVQPPARGPGPGPGRPGDRQHRQRSAHRARVRRHAGHDPSGGGLYARPSRRALSAAYGGILLRGDAPRHVRARRRHGRVLRRRLLRGRRLLPTRGAGRAPRRLRRGRVRAPPPVGELRRAGQRAQACPVRSEQGHLRSQVGSVGAARISRLMREGRFTAPLWWALAASAVPVVACALLALAWVDVGYSPWAIALDVLLVFPVVLGSALVARWHWQPWIAGTCLAALFVAGSAYKVAMMGAPLAPADAAAALELLQVLPGWRLAMAVASAIAWAALLLLSFWPRSAPRVAWLALPLLWTGLLSMLPAPLPWLLQSLDGADAPQGGARLRAQGSIVYMLRAEAEYREEMAEVPTRGQVQAALAALGMQGTAPAQASWTAGRPIHVVLLESLWDARQLDAYRFSSPPMDPRFIAAWEAGGRSSVLSPVLGGATANAEFEFLCAMPALRESIVFDDALRNPVPCLPRILRDAGYQTVAVHPHTAGFWNRDEAYPLLGFEQYRPLASFDMDDMDGMFLADASTFRQVVEWDAAT